MFSEFLAHSTVFLLLLLLLNVLNSVLIIQSSLKEQTITKNNKNKLVFIPICHGFVFLSQLFIKNRKNSKLFVEKYLFN